MAIPNGAALTGYKIMKKSVAAKPGRIWIRLIGRSGGMNSLF